jgi:DNA-binding transcriptional LysR family regulator
VKLQAAIVLFALAAVVLALRWTSVRAARPEPSIRIVLLAGDATTDFARRLATDHQRAIPDSTVTVQTPRADRTLELLRDGSADAAILDHWLPPDERALQTYTLRSTHCA